MNLTSAKIVKVERNGKKTGVHVFSIAEAQRTEAQRTEAESKSDGRAKGILCFGN